MLVSPVVPALRDLSRLTVAFKVFIGAAVPCCSIADPHKLEWVSGQCLSVTLADDDGARCTPRASVSLVGPARCSIAHGSLAVCSFPRTSLAAGEGLLCGRAAAAGQRHPQVLGQCLSILRPRRVQQGTIRLPDEGVPAYAAVACVRTDADVVPNLPQVHSLQIAAATLCNNNPTAMLLWLYECEWYDLMNSAGRKVLVGPLASTFLRRVTVLMTFRPLGRRHRTSSANPRAASRPRNAR